MAPEHLRVVRHPQAARLVALRGRLLAGLRAELARWGLVEVDVPPLLPCAGPEPHLQPPRVDLPGLPGPLWLQTSPELSCKRLLAAGVPALYALGPAFRGGRDELSPLHQPAFTLLEWYRPGSDLAALAQDCRALGRAAAEALGVAAPQVERSLSMSEAVLRFAGLDLGPLLEGDAASRRRFAAAARASGLTRCRDEDDPGTLLGRVLVERVEPALAGLPGWTFLHGWPADLAALARLDSGDPRLALRMEAWLGGAELANGYVELLEGAALGQRWDALAARREGPAIPRDEALLAELAARPPGATVGMALGVDRLAAQLLGVRRIAEVLPLHLSLDAGDAGGC